MLGRIKSGSKRMHVLLLYPPFFFSEHTMELLRFPSEFPNARHIHCLLWGHRM